MISGMQAEVLRPGQPTVDRFGNAVPGAPATETVDGVLVEAPTVDDMEAARPYGMTASVVVHFPKSYAAPLAGCSVRLGGAWEGDYAVVGDPMPYMDANTPGAWNRRVVAGVADG